MPPSTEATDARLRDTRSEDPLVRPPRRARPHRSSVPLYVIVGGIVTGCHYAVVAIAVELFGWWPVAATVVGFVIGAVLKYVLNYFIAFRSAEPHPVALPRFVGFLAVMLALTTLTFTLLYEWAGVHYMVAQVLTTVLLIPVGYVLSRRFVFVRPDGRSGRDQAADG